MGPPYRIAAAGSLRPWGEDDWIGAGTNDVWCRPAPDRPWALQLNLTDSAADHWVFRRNPAVTRPLERIGRRRADGLPYLAPELPLLFKTKATRPRDQADFDVAAPLLDAEARVWLAAAIEATDPGHAWVAQLS